MEIFEYYVEKELVRKASPNKERAKSLISDSEERISKINLLDIENFSKIVFENIYDAIRDLLDALLLLDGWKSYSHEAAIAYLTKKGFDVSVVKELDQYRYKRNGSKYYGEPILPEDSKGIKLFYNSIKGKLYENLKIK